MKKFFSIQTLLVSVLTFSLFACNNKDKKQDEDVDAKIAKVISKADTTPGYPNYRYIDLDSVLSNYNLAKDYNEEMLRMQNHMQSEVKKHENTIQSKYANMQNKMQNNIYMSQASLEDDQKELANLQDKAQKAIAALQSNFENTALLAQKAVNDSIEAFINAYNRYKGYDAIFFKAATAYINPDLDITNEVIEGLNARYNKVKK